MNIDIDQEIKKVNDLIELIEKQVTNRFENESNIIKQEKYNYWTEINDFFLDVINDVLARIVNNLYKRARKK